MKILVASDSHDNYLNLKKAVEKEKDFQALVFLGDGERDYDIVTRSLTTDTYRVRGNNDWDGSIAAAAAVRIGGFRFFLCHGHRYRVNTDLGLDLLALAAKENDCQCALFGHTHCRHYSFRNGIHLFNPGSVSLPRDGSGRSYGIITDDGGKLDFYYGNI
ncbi:MAG: metallophosphoesterase [Firmicutes bacterium]|nr:metallophosphoesterase [[Eubacterium] siraeum]MCM1488278.1 metallophosphoesterase [Bacillota bacterium]